MNCLSLFSGAGGLDLGIEAAGFKIIASIEQDKDCCDTLIKNGRCRVVRADISTIDFAKIAGDDKIDLIVGGPPCQPFSKLAMWTIKGARGLADSRSGTIEEYVRAIDVLKPRAFILENVEGFIKLGGLNTLQGLLDNLVVSGSKYTVEVALINAADFGVPQNRRRLFVVGYLGECEFQYPRPTHVSSDNPPMTAWDACAFVESNNQSENLELKGRWAPLLSSIPPGHNYLWHTSRKGGVPIFGWRTRFWSFLYKLDPNRPSPTIVANPSQNSGPFHWSNRQLSTDELAALQTFPKNYSFSGNRSSRQRQIGNAVPPLLAEHIGRVIMKYLGGRVPNDLMYELKRADSSAILTPVTSAPAEFVALIGKHADHPGPGLGPKPRVSVRS